MEVHHASHGERPRSFKSFAFEFLMISIAVFVGSLGEYFLDHRIIEERLQNGLVSMRDDLDTDLRNLDRIIAQCDNGIAFLTRTRQSAVDYQIGRLSGAEYLRRIIDDLPNVYVYHTFFMDRTSFTNLSSAGLMNVEDSADLRAAISEYYEVYGLNSARLAKLRPGAIVMHPGPINRGVEMSSEAADSGQSMVLRQVRHGVAVRMAVLEMCLNASAQGR